MSTSSLGQSFLEDSHPECEFCTAKFGNMTAKEAAKHDTAHVLTRAVGIREKLELDLGFAEVQPGDRFLLCSDGLYNPVEPEAIGPLLAKGSPEEACAHLVDAAMAGGGRDNITVIVVDADQPD